MAKSVRTYQREVRKLKDLLATVMWVQPSYNGAPSCSYCGAMQHHGHHKECELAAIVGSAVVDGRTPK